MISSFELTRTYIKNKLFEKDKEFKEFKFQQNLKIELTKDEKVFKETKFVDPWLDSYKEVVDNTTNDELFVKQHNDLSPRTENWLE